jgi:hypothetical protein
MTLSQYLVYIASIIRWQVNDHDGYTTTDIHALSGIWNHDLSVQAMKGVRLRPCHHWDQQSLLEEACSHSVGQEFFRLYGIRRYIVVFTRTRYQAISRASWVQSTALQHLYLWPVSIISFLPYGVTAQIGLWPILLRCLTHIQVDTVGPLWRVISPSQRPLPTQDNTTYKHKRQTYMLWAGFEPAIRAIKRP